MLSVLFWLWELPALVSTLTRPGYFNPIHSPSVCQQLHGDWRSQMWRVMKMLAGGGLTITGSHHMCGDYLYSGHTVMLTLTYLFIKECKKTFSVPFGRRSHLVSDLSTRTQTKTNSTCMTHLPVAHTPHIIVFNSGLFSFPAEVNMETKYGWFGGKKKKKRWTGRRLWTLSVSHRLP